MALPPPVTVPPPRAAPAPPPPAQDPTDQSDPSDPSDLSDDDDAAAADAAAMAYADEHAGDHGALPTSLGTPEPVVARAGPGKGPPLLSLAEAVEKVPAGTRLLLEERLRGRFREVRRLDPGVLRVLGG